MSRSVASLAIGIALFAALALALRATLGSRDARHGGIADARTRVPAVPAAATRADPGEGSASSPSSEAFAPPPDARREPGEGEAAAHVLGTIVDAAGAPIAGAHVRLFDGPLHGPRASEPHELSEVSTGADGRFRFAVADAERTHAVRVLAEGFASRSRNQSPGVDVALELARQARWVGALRGEGAREVRVLRAGRSGVEEPWVRLDDGQGAFTYEDAPVGALARVWVVPARGLAFEEGFTLPAPGVHVHDIELGAVRRVSGTVVDAFSGAPIAGARLLAVGGPGPAELDTSDARGMFELELRGLPARALADPAADGIECFVAVEAEGYLRAEPWLGLLARGTALALVPGATLEGRVLASDGGPAHGAELRWIAPLLFLDAQHGPLTVAERARTATTDAEGRFRLAGLPWGAPGGELLARLGSAERWVLDPALDPRVPLVLELRLPSSSTLAGRLVWSHPWDNMGHLDFAALHAGDARFPCPRSALRLVSAEGVELARGETDARGTFAFEVFPPDGWLEIVDHEQATLDGTTRARVALGHAGGAPTVDANTPDNRIDLDSGLSQPLRIAVAPPLWSARGTLRGSAGQLLARQDLTGRLRDQGRRLDTGPFLGTRSDELGGFELAFPDFPGYDALLVVTSGWTELERALPRAQLAWTLPELAHVELELERDPGAARLVAWTGPGAGEGGRSSRHERAVAGRLALELPLGTLELELGLVGPRRGEVERLTVRVEREAPGTAARLVRLR